LAAISATEDALQEKRKLKKSLFRFDMIFFTVCAILAIDTLSQSASYGFQTIFWLVVSAATFMIPYALLSAELGTTFPVEGAVFEWVRLAFGHFAGAITAVLYWLSNPIWLGGTLAAGAIAGMDALWGTKIADNTLLSIIIGLAFVWTAVIMNILSLRSMKWVPNLGSFVKIGLFVLFGVLVLITGTQHGFKGDTSNFFPTNIAIFVGVIGVLIFQWVGFEMQSNASEEMENPQRDIPRSVAMSGVISVISYAIPIAGIVLLLGSKDLSNVSSFATGYQTAVGNALGGGAQSVINGIVGAAIVFALLASGVVWLMGSDRLMAIGALQGSGPRFMGHFSARFGTPITVNVLSGVLSSVFVVATFLITQGNLRAYFGIVLGLAISTTTFSYLAVFPALWVLRRRYPNARRPYRVPGGMLGVAIVVILTEGYALLATIFSLWPNICSVSDGSCFGSSATGQVSGLDRLPYELTVLITVGIVVAVGVWFYLIGKKHAVHDRWPDELAPADQRETAGVRRV
jgi:glutamate:GABA antiporter